MKPTFEEQFKEALADIRREAEELGTDWTNICRVLQISRTTPARWESSTPTTVELLTKVQLYLAELRRQKEANDKNVPETERG